MSCEVKKAGLYKTRKGDQVEIYGFSDASESGEPMAEGCFQSSRKMGWWNPNSGEFNFGGKEPLNDIVELVSL